MINPNKLQYMTMGAWMRGYASGLDENEHAALIFKLKKAADMMDAVWDEYIGKEEEGD